MSITIKAITIDAAGTLIQPWPSVGAVYGEVARNHGIEVQDEAVNERFFEVFGRVQKTSKLLLVKKKTSGNKWFAKFSSPMQIMKI